MNDAPGWNRQTKPREGQPHGWIQWKGTQVCVDLHCICGESFHMDAEFLYYVQCPHCQQSYMLNGHIELVPISPKDSALLDEDGQLKHPPREK